MKRLVLVALLAIAGCAGPDETPPANPSPVGAATGRWREQIHWISMTDAKGASSTYRRK